MDLSVNKVNKWVTVSMMSNIKVLSDKKTTICVVFLKRLHLVAFSGFDPSLAQVYSNHPHVKDV